MTRVQPASAKIETILSTAGVPTASFGVGFAAAAAAAAVLGFDDLGGGKGGAKEEAGLLREGIWWWRNTISAD